MSRACGLGIAKVALSAHPIQHVKVVTAALPRRMPTDRSARRPRHRLRPAGVPPGWERHSARTQFSPAARPSESISFGCVREARHHVDQLTERNKPPTRRRERQIAWVLGMHANRRHAGSGPGMSGSQARSSRERVHRGRLTSRAELFPPISDQRGLTPRGIARLLGIGKNCVDSNKRREAGRRSCDQRPARGYSGADPGPPRPRAPPRRVCQ